MKFSCIIQSRLNSTRLPNKAILNVEKNSTLLEFCISQVKNSKLVENIILATTKLSQDSQLVKIATSKNIDFFRGDEDDVLSRFFNCAKKFSLENIIRITADNPLIDPSLIDKAIEKFSEDKFDYVTNCLNRTFPYGTEVEIFSFSALEKAWKNAHKKSEREHVTPYFYNNPRNFRIYNITNSKNLSHLRYTVDRKNDFEVVKKIIHFVKSRPILLTDIEKLYGNFPEIFSINSNNIPNEGYMKSLVND